MPYVTNIKYLTTVEISDLLLRTGDLLSPVMDTVGTHPMALQFKGGDGAIVVHRHDAEVPYFGKVSLVRPMKGLQDRTAMTIGARTLIHPYPQLATTKLRHYLSPLQIRTITSKPLTDIALYKAAYNNIKSKPGYMTKGTDGNTLDGMSLKLLEKLVEDIRSWKYECKPTRRVYIKKANGKMRPLGIPSTRDKILQLGIKMILEENCEKIFSPRSFGFRPNKSVHHALRAVQGMVGIT